MYGGVGLLTPRGSGTSGYVTTNKFNLHRAPPTRHSDRPDEAALLNRGPNKEILDHNRKRELELEVAKQQDKLEAEGKYSELEIEDLLTLFRQQQMAKYLDNQPSGDKKMSTETHEVAQRKADQMEKLRSALGVSSTGSEGDAFNRELQAKVRQDRIDAKEAKETQRAEQQELREKDSKRREKEERKRAKQDVKDRQAAEEARKEAALQAERQQQLIVARQREDAVQSLQGRDRFVGRITSSSGRDGGEGRRQQQDGRVRDNAGNNGREHVYSKYEQPPDRYQPDSQLGNGSPPDNLAPSQRSSRVQERPSSQRSDRQQPQAPGQHRGSDKQAPGTDLRLQEMRSNKVQPLREGKVAKKATKQASPSSSSNSSSGSGSSSGDSSSDSGSESSSGTSSDSSSSGSDSDSKPRERPRNSGKVPDVSRTNSRFPAPPSEQHQREKLRSDTLPGPPPRDTTTNHKNGMLPPPSRNGHMSSPPAKRHRPDSSPLPSPPRNRGMTTVASSRAQHQRDPEPKVREWDTGKEGNQPQLLSNRSDIAVHDDVRAQVNSSRERNQRVTQGQQVVSRDGDREEEEPPRERVDRERPGSRGQARPSIEPKRQENQAEEQMKGSGRGRQAVGLPLPPSRSRAAESDPRVAVRGSRLGANPGSRSRSPVRRVSRVVHSPPRNGTGGGRSPSRGGGRNSRPEPSPSRQSRVQQNTSRSPPRAASTRGQGVRQNTSPMQQDRKRADSPARGGRTLDGNERCEDNDGSRRHTGGSTRGSTAVLPGPPSRIRADARRDSRARPALESPGGSPPRRSRNGGMRANSDDVTWPAAAVVQRKRSVSRSPSSNSQSSDSSSSRGQGRRSNSGSQSTGSSRSGSSSGSGSGSDSGSEQ